MMRGLYWAPPEAPDLGDDSMRHLACGSRHVGRHRRAAIETAAFDRIDDDVLRRESERAGEANRLGKAEGVA